MAGRNSFWPSIASPASDRGPEHRHMPDLKEEIRERLAHLKLSPTREAEVVEELAQHLEEQYDDAISRGASEEEARTAALADLAESDLLARELKRVERDRQHEPLGVGSERGKRLSDLAQDLRYGPRMMAKTPAIRAIAIIALAHGLAA